MAQSLPSTSTLPSTSNPTSTTSPTKNKIIEKPMQKKSNNPGFKTSSFLPSDWNSGLPEEEVPLNEDGEDVDGEDLDGVDVDGEEVDVDGEEVVFVPPPSVVPVVEEGRRKRPTAVDVEDEGEAMQIGSDDDIF